MKIHNIQENYKNYDSVIKVTDFEHFFDIYTFRNGTQFYNLNETLFLDVGSGEGFPVYVPKRDKQWSLVSYDIYKTTRLAWLLMKLNKVDAKHMFDPVKVGQRVIYLPRENVQSMLDRIRSA